MAVLVPVPSSRTCSGDLSRCLGRIGVYGTTLFIKIDSSVLRVGVRLYDLGALTSQA